LFSFKEAIIALFIILDNLDQIINESQSISDSFILRANFEVANAVEFRGFEYPRYPSLTNFHIFWKKIIELISYTIKIMFILFYLLSKVEVLKR